MFTNSTTTTSPENIQTVTHLCQLNYIVSRKSSVEVIFILIQMLFGFSDDTVVRVLHCKILGHEFESDSYLHSTQMLVF